VVKLMAGLEDEEEEEEAEAETEVTAEEDGGQEIQFPDGDSKTVDAEVL